jgi:hypothetical protein
MGIGEHAIAAGVEVDEPFGLFADNRGELVSAGWVAQVYGKTVGAVEGLTQPGALQGEPRAPLCEQRVDTVKMSEQGAARMGDPRRASRGQRLGHGRDPGLLMGLEARTPRQGYFPDALTRSNAIGAARPVANMSATAMVKNRAPGLVGVPGSGLGASPRPTLPPRYQYPCIPVNTTAHVNARHSVRVDDAVLRRETVIWSGLVMLIPSGREFYW